MTARRLLAGMAAVALVVGALLVRRNVIEGDDGDADEDSANPSEPATELVCVTELEVVCNALETELEVTVEDAGETLDRLTALADTEPRPVWLTIAPFPEMVDSLREGARLDPLFGDPQALAASRLALATPVRRMDVLTTHCAGTPLWHCVGDAAGQPWTELDGEEDWGDVRPSVGDAARSATALASFADAVAGYFDDASVAQRTWEQDSSFLPWVRDVVDAVPLATLSGGTPLLTMLRRPSAVNVAATSDAEIASLGAAIEGPDTSYPEPSMWLQAVLAAPAGADIPQGLADDVAQRLQAAGWEPPEAATEPLPSANTMIALRLLWEDLQQ